MKRNKIASITLYVLVLVFFAMIFAYVVLSNMVTMNNKQKISDLTEYERNILTKNANLNLEYNLKLNSDWFWFKDNRKCPDIIHDDWNWIINTITTNIFVENISWVDKFYCKSNTVDLKLEFSKYNSLSKEERKTVDSFFVNDSSWKIFNNLIYNWNTTSISWNPVSYWANETFDIQTTIWTDGLDDNLNDDDFQVNATYPNIDNDIESRTSIIWVILDSKSKVNIFANDEKSNKFIEKNTKNIIPIKKITDTTIGNIKIKVELSEDINPEPTFEIIQIPKNSANTQNSQTNISLNLEKEINYEFDFANNYYWIFLESWEDLKGISYKLTAFTNSGERLYINPIDDSIDWIVEIYQNYVFNHAWTNVIKWWVFSMKKL